MYVELRLQAIMGKARGGVQPPLTSLVCQNDYKFSILFCDYNVRNLSTPLERCFQDLFNGILQVLESLQF